MRTNKEIVEDIMKEYGNEDIEEIEKFYKNNKKNVDRILEIFTKCITQTCKEQNQEKINENCLKDLMCSQLNAYRNPEKQIEEQWIKNRLEMANLQMEISKSMYKQQCCNIEPTYYPDYRTYDNMPIPVNVCNFPDSVRYTSPYCKRKKS